MTEYFYIADDCPPVDRKFVWVFRRGDEYHWIDQGTRITRTIANGYIVQSLTDDAIIIHRLRGIKVNKAQLSSMCPVLQHGLVNFGMLN